MAFDPRANPVTAYGFEALRTEALETTVLDSAAVSAAGPAVGGGAAPGVALRITEPGPDAETGEMDLGLGDDLVMRVFTEDLFDGDPDVHQPIQGFLGNCPLAAILCAMAHVPAQRRRLRHEIVVERPIEVHSSRQRRAFEWFSTDVPAPLPRDPPTGHHVSFRLFQITFKATFHGTIRTLDLQGLTDDEKRAMREIYLRFLTRPSVVPTTPVLFTDLNAGGVVHYMRTPAPLALWPSIIEKAYAIGRGQNSYDGINNDIGLAECMQDMTGFAIEEHLIADEPVPEQPPPPPPVTDQTLRRILHRHNRRPTILGSIGTPADARIRGNHTFAVTRFQSGDVRVVDPIEETPATREITIPFNELRDSFGEVVQGPE
jgi:hypothetical protein